MNVWELMKVLNESAAGAEVLVEVNGGDDYTIEFTSGAVADPGCVVRLAITVSDLIDDEAEDDD